jgi:enoyl-CoA hydratase/carnithine racemase
MNFADYRHLAFDLKPSGVLLITINRPEVMNATNARLHWELTQVWLTVDADPTVRVVFDQSLALEMLTFMGEDVREGVDALRRKRAPSFPSAR